MGRGVAGGLGQGGVELWFGLGVIGAAGGGRGCAGRTFFGQAAAAGAFGRGQGAAVAADDEDLGVKVGPVDGCQGAAEELAVEGAPLLGSEMARQAAFAFVEGLDGDDKSQPRAVLRVILHFGAGADQ